MSMSKTKNILLETTATYQPLSDLNVRFWSQDKNTAELRFIITRNQFPLSLSKENVKVIIALESGSSFISSDDFIIDSEVEGVARYIIPTDFMRVASNVTGQVYVTTLDKEEIIVERQFKFTVSNDLLSDYPSEDELRYIKTFDDLRNEIASRVSKLESDMETMEDYVVQVQDTTQEGITALTNLIKQKQDAYNANHTAKMKELNDKGSEYSAKFDDDKVYMDDKFQAFQESVNGSGLITTGQSKDWQKYKLTSDDGTRTYLPKGSFEDVHALEPGYYETVSNDTPTQGFPLEFANAAFIEIDVTKSSSESGRKQIQVTQSSRPQTFVKYIHTGGVDYNGWKEIPYVNAADPFETVNGSQNKANTAENNAKTYTDDKVSAQRAVLFSGSVNGVGQKIDLTESMDNYSILIVSGGYPGGNFDEVVVVSNIGSGHPVQRVNLSNPTATGAIIYEMELTKDSNTRFNIIRDNYYGIVSGEGTINSDSFTIRKIEAIK